MPILIIGICVSMLMLAYFLMPYIIGFIIIWLVINLFNR
jgi:hypothetical protein